ncbi:hypothetical protein MUU74_11250 [Chryseobacterium daecheongense]|uniref:hypothetical protein n=1 Tax=Chryseobacterium daecheongense TaxID=192389 RepID=UPI001FD70A42|nr:hypothetical protein [Chryseobacterium daecheongense]UOU97069.1 hypothetical protein MUU74_11250 [Chryseobacterium daecheongense]
MKKLLISTILLLGMSMHVSAQKHPPRPPVPSRAEMINLKSRELDKKYNTEKKMILKHPLLSKKMKQDQVRALTEKYKREKRALRNLP